ncbi:MAG: hypothetical protein H6722_18650 [Sandaracinus sp.]|nr:hypothetical protein [Sandaracinus sp.]
MLGRKLGFALLSLLAGWGCGDDDAPATDASVDAPTVDTDAGPAIDVTRPECENLDPTHCLMPYPSSRFLAEDTTTETGFRVAIPEAAFPLNRDADAHASTDPWNRFDGFSINSSLVVAFEGRVDPSNLPNHTRIAASLEADSPTVIVDVETGERVAHFAELDEWETVEWLASEPGYSTLYLRPAVPLQYGRRYVAAVRGLRRLDGTEVEASPYFRALRDDETTDVAELESRRAAQESVFSTLASAGVAREDLVLAWDFRTASASSVQGQLLSMREDAFRRFDDESLRGTPNELGVCRVRTVEENVSGRIWRRIRGTYTVPLYMTTPFEGAVAFRDEEGNVAYNGVAEAPFEVVIPPSVHARVMAGGEGAKMLHYGHGLLGSESQVSGDAAPVAQREQMVAFGTRFWGLGSDDTAQILTYVVTNFGNIAQLGERLMQGTINSLIQQKAFSTGQCSRMPELFVDVEGESRPLHDPTEVYYYGISQGGIMGATLAALSDTVDAYVLQVGGINYGIMLRRSVNFRPYEAVFKLFYERKLDRDWFVVSTQPMWDLAEPATYVDHIFGEPLPGVDNTQRRILYQVSRYDAQVPNVTADMAARTMRLPWLRSSAYEPWGVGDYLEASDGGEGSGYTIFQLEGVEPINEGCYAEIADNAAHGGLRSTEPMLQQFERFVREGGVVEDTCPEGSCVIPNERGVIP